MRKSGKPAYVASFNQLISNHFGSSLYSEVSEEYHSSSKTISSSAKSRCTQCNSINGGPDLSKIAARSTLQSLLVQCEDNDFSVIRDYIRQKLKQISSANINDVNNNSNIEKLSLFVSVVQNDLQRFDSRCIILEFCAENYLPIILIWKLSSIISFEKIFCKWNNTSNLNLLKSDLIYNVHNCASYKEKREAVEMTVASLIFFRYELPSNSSSLGESSQEILTHLIQAVVETCLTDASKASCDIMNVYHMLIENVTLRRDRLQLFMADQMKLILTQETDISLSSALENQSRWSSVSSSKFLLDIFYDMISFLGYSQVLEIFDSAVTTSEVNWGTILTLLGCILTFSQDACVKVRSMIEDYLVKGCKHFESEYVILGFLFARHAGQEGRHVFPSYPLWFATAFGAESSSPANSKASFSFLIEFLKELVPYERRDTLYAHTSQSIFIPSGCRDIWRDYRNLAKARIQELDDATGQSVTLEAEIAQRIAEFEETGRISSTLNETVIFHRAKFLGSFLPALLAPRLLPDVPDARMNFITALMSSKKIPTDVYNKYVENCEQVAQGCYLGSQIVNTKGEDIISLVDSAKKLSSGQGNSALVLFSKISHFIDQSRFPSEVKEKEKLTKNVSLKIIAVISDLYFEGNVPNVTDKRQIIQQMLSVTASNQAVHDEILKDLCDFTTNKTDKELTTIGVIMAEVASGKNLFLSVADSTGNLSPIDYFMRKLLLTESIYCSCSIVASWIEWAFVSEIIFPDTIYSLYCCLAMRVAFIEQLNVVPFVNCEAKLSAHFPVSKPGYLPNCCVFFWKHFTEIKKPTIREWVQFELTHRWSGLKWNFSLAFLEFWLNELFFKNDSLLDYFHQYFITLVLNFGQSENYSLLVVALQNTVHRLFPKPVIFDSWLQFSSDEQAPKMVDQFINVAMCLPRDTFFGTYSLTKASNFTSFIHDILNITCDLFLDLRCTSYFLEVILATNAQQLMTDVTDFLEPVLESIMFHLHSVKYILNRWENTIQKTISLKNKLELKYATQQSNEISVLISIMKENHYPDHEYRSFHYIACFVGHMVMRKELDFFKSSDNCDIEQFVPDITAVLSPLDRRSCLTNYLKPEWCSAIVRPYRQKVLYTGTIYAVIYYVKREMSRTTTKVSSGEPNLFSSCILLMLTAYQELSAICDTFVNDSCCLSILEIRREIIHLINHLPSLSLDKYQYQDVLSCDTEIITAIDNKIGIAN